MFHRLNRSAHEKAVKGALGLVEEIGRGRVETVCVSVILVLPGEEVGSIHVVQRVIRLIRGRVLLLGSNVVSVRPALPERSDSVVHAVVGALHRQPRALARSHLHIRERLEEVSVAEVHVLQTPMPGQGSRKVFVSVSLAGLLHLGGGHQANFGLVCEFVGGLFRSLGVHLLPLRRSQSWTLCWEEAQF